MKQDKSVLKLFESCLITKGANRSIIVDSTRNAYYLIPNSLAELFNDDHFFDVQPENYNAEEQQAIKEYCDFLIERELAFYCSRDLATQFPVKSQEWDYPASITNAVFEVTTDIFEDRYKTMSSLIHDYLIRYIEVFISEPVELTQIAEITSKLDKLDLYNYNLIFSLKNNTDLEKVIRVLKSHYKAFRSTIYNTGRDEVILAERGGWNNIFLFEGEFTYNYCGVVDTNCFSINADHITESYHFNTCLNRKLAVDIDGNIKNCPAMTSIHGNIKDTHINELLERNSFKEYWKVTKDQVDTCKDCEYRNICTDCRAFTENPDDKYSKPLKCGYDPYTNEWDDWSKNPLKQKAVEYYSL